MVTLFGTASAALAFNSITAIQPIDAGQIQRIVVSGNGWLFTNL